jgi:glycosyltransferase involved in cell wall biosynthesis
VNNIIFYGHSPNLGGAEKSLFELVKSVKLENRFTPIVILPSKEGLITNWYKSELIDVKILDFPWMVSDNSDQDLDEFMSQVHTSYNRHLNLILSLKPTAIFTQTSVQSISAICAANLEIPHFWNIREYGAIDHKLNEIIKSTCGVEQFISLSDKIYVSSKALGNYLFGSRKVNWEPLYSQPKSQSLGEEKVKENQNYFRFVFAGSLTPSKNPLLLINFALNLKESGFKFKIDVFGIGELENELRSFINYHGISDQIELMGHNSDLENLYMNYDFVISCAPNEAFGRSLSEGAVRGCIPIYPQIESWSERFVDGETGISYPLEDPRAMAKKIIALSSDSEIQRIRKNLRLLSSEGFGIPDPAHIFMRDLDKVVREKYRKKFINRELINLLKLEV